MSGDGGQGQKAPLLLVTPAGAELLPARSSAGGAAALEALSLPGWICPALQWASFTCEAAVKARTYL